MSVQTATIIPIICRHRTSELQVEPSEPLVQVLPVKKVIPVMRPLPLSRVHANVVRCCPLLGRLNLNAVELCVDDLVERGSLRRDERLIVEPAKSPCPPLASPRKHVRNPCPHCLQSSSFVSILFSAVFLHHQLKVQESSTTRFSNSISDMKLFFFFLSSASSCTGSLLNSQA